MWVKICLSIRGMKDVFEPMYSPTIGFEFMAFYVKVNGQIIKMQIWDTCGQEVYRSLISSFYNNSSLEKLFILLIVKKVLIIWNFG